MAKKILIISTGGTIISKSGKNGLTPSGEVGSLLDIVRTRFPGHDISLKELMRLDSSNIQPEHWREISIAVYDALLRWDGVVITHGTDTMAYTASALAFMLRNLQKSVVLTGSQMPYCDPLSDAPANLCTATSAVLNDIVGVTVAFDHKIINGLRAVKTSTMGMDAFESPNAPIMAAVSASGLDINVRSTSAPAACAHPLTLENKMCGDVLLLKLIPGTKPELLSMLPDMGYRGVVIEAFGAGGAHNIGRDITIGLKSLMDAGVPVVVRSQCPRGRADLSIYEVGRLMRSMGVISAGDMTAEAAVTKLMWALGMTSDMSEITDIFNTNFAGEITLPNLG
ncbi:MAG: asparaginase [Synergistaceae bacterium]|jgi:L-asparaginase|nr:asparaginase [Synergistaceae bacterium]